MLDTKHRITAWDIENARRVYANAVLSDMDQDTVAKARGWLEFVVERAKEQR